MALSKANATLALRNGGILRVMFIRSSHAPAGGAEPPQAKIHWSPPASEIGYYNCKRDWSRDPRYGNPAKPGDTPTRFLLRKLDHAYEIYPIFALTGLWCVLFAFTVYWSFSKIEVYLDHTHKLPPWDWERARDNYWKKPTLLFDPDGRTHARLPPIFEKLQDEMVAAAKERGTR